MEQALSGSWNLPLPCPRAEAEALSEDEFVLATLDPLPVLMTGEMVADDAGRWQLDAYFEEKPDAQTIAAVRELVSFYLGNASYMQERLNEFGISVYGGQNAPYLWLQTPGGMASWGFFYHLLQRAHVVGTPGSGFGAAGEGFFRLSAFNHRDQIELAMDRIGAL